MKSRLGNPFFLFGLVLSWRVALLVFMAQPIPFNDAFGYDGAVVNYLHGGRYCNPSMALIFPISGTEVYATYPPLYQGALFVWMKLFGTSVISAMALHLMLFAIAGFLTLALMKKFFPAATGYAITALLFFGFTIGDRPESLAFVFGLTGLWLVARQISENEWRPGIALGLLLALLLGLYTSVIVGAYFFGAGFLACAFAFMWRRKLHWFVPFLGAAGLFAVITFSIAKLEPLWWAGFMESARQQSVMTGGAHAPPLADVLKLIRTAPVFLLGLAALPLIFARRREIFANDAAWLALSAGIFVMGWMLLVACMIWVAPTYVSYVMFTQLLLAAGLLALAQKYFPARERLLRLSLLACVLLVSVRAIGITTWGMACTWNNSYRSTQTVLRTELEPFVNSARPVLVSSAYLYCAADLGVKNPIHSDWYYDHANRTNGVEINALTRLQPTKLLLTQFDYYRAFEGPLQQLGQHPELVEIRLRNLAVIAPPDASPALRRVVQHISWAPVIVDLNWKNAPPP